MFGNPSRRRRQAAGALLPKNEKPSSGPQAQGRNDSAVPP
ncbi:hypothetical protein HMPREF1868_01044 [Olsenella sp. DNF00959]|nr:hypothetical protein HMPREF1868_01044 [Olsenella sp. DNF00959]